MLKYTLIIAGFIGFFVGSPFIANGQIHVGAKAGANLNHTSFQDPATYSPGFNLGVFATYDVTDYLFVNSEIAYSQIGGGYDSGYYYVEPEVFRQQVKLNFHTVAIPLYISATLPSLASSSVRPLLMAGAEYAYSIRTMESYQYVYSYKGENYTSAGRSRSVNDDFEKHQPSMLFGAGVAMTLFGMPSSIDFRYKSTFNKTTIPNGNTERLKMLSINVGVTLIDL